MKICSEKDYGGSFEAAACEQLEQAKLLRKTKSAKVRTDTCTRTITKTACQNAKLVQTQRQNMRQTPLSKVGIFSPDDVSLYAVTPRSRLKCQINNQSLYGL